MLVCSKCQKSTEKWTGQCPSCRAWNTLTDGLTGASEGLGAPVLLHEIQEGKTNFIPTGTSELDRVLGGGLARGGAYLLGGDPGSGKSTLTGQVSLDLGKAKCEDPRDNRVLYVSTEETPLQIANRKRRLDPKFGKPLLWIYHESDLGKIEKAILDFNPGTVVVDSVGMLYHPNLDVRSGSVPSVIECAKYFVSLSKSRGIVSILIAHVTKDGSIAGPKAFEHLVDCTLYFEKERGHDLRTLHAPKNRFASTNEVGIFRMTENGLRSVANPGELLFARETWGPGCVLGSTIKGSRALILEVQALLGGGGMEKNFRRSVTGIARDRVDMLAAVVSRQTKQSMACDLWVNVPGGLDIDDPACDLAVCAALISSALDVSFPSTLFIGEVGLGGEVRPCADFDARLAQAKILKVEKIFGPELPAIELDPEMRKIYVGVPNIKKLERILSRPRKATN